MKKNFANNEWKIIRYDDGVGTIEEDNIAEEYPLTLMVDGEEFATIVCSFSNVEALLVGFLASEGLIRSYWEIRTLHVDDTRGFAYVELQNPINPADFDHSKRFIGSCCGKSRQFYLKNDVRTAKTIMNRFKVNVHQCYSLMEQFQEMSAFFQETGGVHNAALCTVDEILLIRTDIGRHNALDKVYGEVLVNTVPIQDKMILFSGRVSSEVLLKVAKIGVGIIISKSAPTDLALSLATDLGITVVGFARGKKMNVYTHHEWIESLK